MTTLRNKKSHKNYLRLIANGLLATECNLCSRKKAKSIKNFKYWRIVNNRFPYDLIAKTHHMIIPKRHVSENKLNKEEEEEFKTIKARYINKKYEYMMEGMEKIKSIPAHFHIHLLILKN